MRAFLLFLLSSISVLLPSIAYSGIQCDADRFSFSISMPKGYLSGVLITNESDDSINGSMINEFGISAVDFTYSRRNGKFRLVSVISFLDKWHIRRMLGNDLRFCLRILKGLNLQCLWIFRKTLLIPLFLLHTFPFSFYHLRHILSRNSIIFIKFHFIFFWFSFLQPL